MSDPYLDDLRMRIAQGRVVAIIGAGVAIGAVAAPQRTTASWTGLLEHGVERCRRVDPTLTADWEQRVRHDIQSALDVDLLAAAEKVSTILQRRSEYTRWLEDTVGSLEPADRRVLDAIAALPVAMATTNYDGLLETVTGQPPLTWREGEKVARWLQGDRPGILHLHGYWEDSQSVVLGIRSYEDVIRDPRIQAALRAVWPTRTLLFIGYGKGLRDPNFGPLFDWAGRTFSGSPYRHYRLVRSAELQEVAREHAGVPIAALSFGDTFEDLPAFLRDLAPAMAPGGGTAGAVAVSAVPASAPPSAAPQSAPAGSPPASGDSRRQPPGVPARTPLVMHEVEQRIFGLDDSQSAQRLRVQFRAIAHSTADRPLYLMGDEEATRRLVLSDHCSAYYQGSQDVLKLQSVALPAGARQIRARSMGNDPSKEYVPLSWVFLQHDNLFEQLAPSAWDGEHRYVLPAEITGAALYIVAVYRDGRVFYTGADQIWIETGDLAGRIERVSVWFGGQVRAVRFRHVFELPYDAPLQFLEVPSSRSRSQLIDQQPAAGRFAPLMGYFSTADSVRRMHEEQQSWERVLSAWAELRGGAGDEWSSLELQDVTAHLVVTATGELAQPPAGRRARRRSPAGASRSRRSR